MGVYEFHTLSLSLEEKHCKKGVWQGTLPHLKD